MPRNPLSITAPELRASITLGALLLLLAIPALVLAQDPLVPCGTSETGPCTICHLAELIVNITNFLMYYVALPSTALLVAIGGIMLLISGPSEPMRNRGKEILKATIIGVIIVFLGWILVDTVIKVVTDRSDSSLLESIGPWNDFDVEACAEEV